MWDRRGGAAITERAMKRSWKTLGGAGTLTVVLFAAGFGAARAVDGEHGFDQRNLARTLAPLGAEQQCERYSVLPARWRDEPRAGMVRLRGSEFVFGSGLGYADERPARDGRIASPRLLDRPDRRDERTVRRFRRCKRLCD
ncbi:hypothetical protein AWB76_02256 [Caballeronia temeraria]|uniref:Uncharacterized protein n=1 Tax=Caballeronia temeraria TaxID=1777137 RepID=A0A158AEK5_9BURK|nr:hypothetical protein AWB76_02256 [Caballeronia temeraria]